MAQPMPLTSIASTPAVILAGGLGTRLRPALADLPKVLAPVHGRPFLAYLLDWLESAGWRKVVLCTGYMGDRIEREFGSGYGQLALKYSVEDEPRGTAGALRLALPQIDADLCLVMNGDSFVKTDLKAFFNWHQSRPYRGSLLLTQVEDSRRYGTVETDANGKILAFREKQGLAIPGWISAGIYLLSRQLLEPIPAEGAVSIERQSFPEWIQQGLGGFRASAEFIDIGTPESFAAAEKFFAAENYHQKTELS